MPSSTTTCRARILIVDDHPIFCEGLSAILRQSDDLEVIGIAWTGSKALSAARELQPEIILLDISLSSDDPYHYDGYDNHGNHGNHSNHGNHGNHGNNHHGNNGHNAVSGLDLVHQLRCICPDVKIAMLTGYPSDEYLMCAMRLGVEAYLQKDLPPETLLASIRQVRAGERVIGNPHQLTTALNQLQVVYQERARAQTGLTESELEMLRLAATGCNNKEIGVRQFWSEITVKRKMQAVYRKLGVTSRAQAVAEVIRRGFV